ncbi:unnamed protein product [Allacma fusca]|uniref:S-formylglutathione hydrolase n=1 Tax=Allacma fusca TaxID=39272 RepID=A0A8J2PMI2_9HEXA|nr:unnamed protein product [Allacma fusca]
MTIELVSKTRCFGGLQKVYKHESSELNCTMKFSLYEPEQRADTERFHVLFYLSGLTCTEENFIQKSGFQKYANEQRLMVVGPDTSPRGCNIPGDRDAYDFGEGAGFYVDATKEPWSKHYRMYSYVTKELPTLIRQNFPFISGKFGIFGHSMGGHGAISIGLRNPNLFKSISAFAPICNPSNSPWGRDKTFKFYLGEDIQDEWGKYDSKELVLSYAGPPRKILVDQGTEDDFLSSHLMPETLKDAATANSNVDVELRMQEGYNHSYFFIATFIEDHLKHHAHILNAA